jgi:hypothetical protein
MVSRFFEAIGEVLAPPVRNPLEDFKTHWKHISHFYIDQRGDFNLILNIQRADRFGFA